MGGVKRGGKRECGSFYSIKDSNFVSSLSPKIAVLGSGIQCIFASKYVFKYMKTGYIEQ